MNIEDNEVHHQKELEQKDVSYCPFCKSNLKSKNKEFRGQKLYECGTSIHILNIDQCRTKQCLIHEKEEIKMD